MLFSNKESNEKIEQLGPSTNYVVSKSAIFDPLPPFQLRKVYAVKYNGFKPNSF